MCLWLLILILGFRSIGLRGNIGGEVVFEEVLPYDVGRVAYYAEEAELSDGRRIEGERDLEKCSRQIMLYAVGL